MTSISSRVLTAGQACVTACWATGFSLVGRFRHPTEEWRTTGGERVLVIAPHPDDELAGCGGVILLHLLAGDSVAVVYATDGRQSRSGGLEPDAMALTREAEAAEALAALGVSERHWVGLKEGHWQGGELAPALTRILTFHDPSIVYAPSRVDFHPEHDRVARVLACLPALQSVRTVRVYQVQVPLTRLLANLVTPIAPVWGRFESAVACYRSQQGSLRGPLRLKEYAGRAHRVRGPAEEFWEMSPSAYTALHTDDSMAFEDRTFRGLRLRSITDPLAFAVGRGTRRRLLAAARRS